MIRLHEISKAYGNHQVLDGINLDLSPGHVYGIVGENGAGKTTLFRCIAGLEPCQGTIQAPTQPLKDHTGFLPTNPEYLSRITGWEYLKLMSIARDLREDDFAAQNVFDLPLDQYAQTYSTGMKKKLALMGILLQKNDLFILDEPFNGVDIHSNMIIQDLIRKLRSLKKIILILLATIALVAAGYAYDMYAGPQLVPVSSSPRPEIAKESGNPVPDFHFTTLSGQTIDITTFRGKPVIVNFWATWCPTCLNEMPAILDLVQSFEGRVILLAISSDHTPEDINRFLKKQPEEIKAALDQDYIKVVFDENRAITHDIFLTERYPETIILSPKGEMIRKIVGGFEWNGQEIRDFLSSLE